MRRLLGGLQGEQRFGTFAGTAAAAGVGVAAVAIVAGGSAAAAAAATVDMGCSNPASQTPCPAVVAPAKRAERWLGPGGNSCWRRVSHHVVFRVSEFAYASCVRMGVCGYLTAASLHPAAALLSTHTRSYLAALEQGNVAREIAASVSLRRQEVGLHGKKSCQLSLGEI